MAKKNETDFVTAFAEEVKGITEAHYRARDIYQDVVKAQRELMILEDKKNEAVNRKNYSNFMKLQNELSEHQTKLKELEQEAAEASQLDNVTREKVEQMQAIFVAKLDKADKADLDEAMPLFEKLREIARKMEKRNADGYESIRSLNLVIDDLYVPARKPGLVWGIRSMLACREFRELIGADPNVTNPFYVEL